MSGRGTRRVVVLDDDPTGVQTLSGITVLLDWDAPRIARALVGRRAVHLITNTRALPPDRVERFVAEAARAAREGAPDASIVLRGDSTLRGHLLEEYLGLRSVVAPEAWPVLLLVPALPSAGRVTVGGVHLFERDGRRTPLHETEFAHDGVFAYTSSRLLKWAEERSGGLFRAGDGRELPLDELRDDGTAGVGRGAAGAFEGGPTVRARSGRRVPSTTSSAIAEGWRRAVEEGVDVIVRCAPTFAGVLAGDCGRRVEPAPGYDERPARRVRLVRRADDASARTAPRRMAARSRRGGCRRARGYESSVEVARLARAVVGAALA